MRALITGGGGFIGSHLAERLLRDGHSVTVLLGPGESDRNLRGLAVDQVVGDVLDDHAVAAACAGADLVFHLAARTDLEGKRLADYEVNVRGTRNVVTAAEAASVRRLVFYSSMLAVRLTRSREPIDESFSAAPDMAYGQSKREGEAIIAGARVPWTIIRPTLVYGPRERSTMLAFLRAVKRRQFLLIGDDVWQSFVYVKNLVEGSYQASLHPAAAGEIFFLNDARAYTLAEFSRALAAAAGVRLLPFRLPRALAMSAAHVFNAAKVLSGAPVPLTPSRVRTMTSHYVYSTRKAMRLFDYRPPYALTEAVAETVGWYSDERLI